MKEEMSNVLDNFDLSKKFSDILSEGYSDIYRNHDFESPIEDFDGVDDALNMKTMGNTRRNSINKAYKQQKGQPDIEKGSTIIGKSLFNLKNARKDKEVREHSADLIADLITKIYGAQEGAGLISPEAYNRVVGTNTTVTAGNMLSMANPSIKYPVYIYQNPRYIDDEEKALEENVYFEPQTVMIIEINSKSKGVEVHSQAFLDAKEIDEDTIAYDTSGTVKINVLNYSPSSIPNKGTYYILSTGKESPLYISEFILEDDYSGAIPSEDDIISSFKSASKKLYRTLSEAKKISGEVKVIFKGPNPYQFLVGEGIDYKNENGLRYSKNGIFMDISNKKSKSLIESLVNQSLKIIAEKVSGKAKAAIENIDIYQYMEAGQTNIVSGMNLLWDNFGDIQNVPLWNDAYTVFNWGPNSVSDSIKVSTSGLIQTKLDDEVYKTLYDIFLNVSNGYYEDDKYPYPFLKRSFFNSAVEFVKTSLENDSPIITNGQNSIVKCAIDTIVLNGMLRAKSNFFSAKNNKTYKGQEIYYTIFKTFKKAKSILCYNNGKVSEMPVIVSNDGKHLQSIDNENNVSTLSNVTIDHINGVHSSNELENLRLTTKEYNSYYSSITAKATFSIIPIPENINKFLSKFDQANRMSQLSGINNVMKGTVDWSLGEDDGNGVEIVLPYGTYNIGGERGELSYKNQYMGMYRIEINGFLSSEAGYGRDIFFAKNQDLFNQVRLDAKIFNITENDERTYFFKFDELKNAGNSFFTRDEKGAVTPIDNTNFDQIGMLAQTKGTNIAYANNLDKNGLLKIIEDKYRYLATDRNEFGQPYIYVSGKVFEGKKLSDAKSKINEEKDDHSRDEEKLMSYIKKGSEYKEMSLTAIVNRIEELCKSTSELLENKLKRRAHSKSGLSFVIDFGVRTANDKIKKIESDKRNWRGGYYMSRDTSQAIISTNKETGQKEAIPVILKCITSPFPVTSILGRCGTYDGKVVHTSEKSSITVGYPNTSKTSNFRLVALDENGRVDDKMSGKLSSQVIGLGSKRGYSMPVLSKASPEWHIIAASSWKTDVYCEAVQREFEKGNEVPDLVVHHINGIPSDFRPDNLTWVNSRDNTIFDSGNGIALFRIYPGTGIENPILAWVTEKDYNEYVAKKGKFVDSEVGIIGVLPKAKNNGTVIDQLEYTKEVLPGDFITQKFRYILRRVVMIDAPSTDNTEENLKDNIKYIIGFEHKGEDGSQKYLTYSDFSKEIKSNLTDLDTNQKVDLYLEGKLKFEKISDNGEVKESFRTRRPEDILYEDSLAYKRGDYDILKPDDLVFSRIEKINEKIPHSMPIYDRCSALNEMNIKVIVLEKRHQDMFWKEDEINPVSLSSLWSEVSIGKVNPDTLSVEMVRKLYELISRDAKSYFIKSYNDKALNNVNEFSKTIRSMYIEREKQYKNKTMLIRKVLERYN